MYKCVHFQELKVFVRTSITVTITIVVNTCMKIISCPSLYLHSWRCQDCRRQQWHTHTSSRVYLTCLHVVNLFCSKRKDSAITHISFLLWSSRCFDVVVLTSAFFLFKPVPNRWFCRSLHWYTPQPLQSNSFQVPIQHLKSLPGLLSTPFILN